MKTYRGVPERTKQGGMAVEVAEFPEGSYRGKLNTLDPGPSQKVWNHSPDGFNWGYAGSGPAQLALALLLDVTGDKDLSSRLHQPFKFEVVSTWPMDQPWEYTEEQVRAWLATQENKNES